VIGVGVRLAVCLKGAKIEKSLFLGLRNQYAPKTSGNVGGPSGRPTGEIWSTKCTLVEGRCQKHVVLGADPQTGSSIGKFFRSIL